MLTINRSGSGIFVVTSCPAHTSLGVTPWILFGIAVVICCVLGSVLLISHWYVMWRNHGGGGGAPHVYVAGISHPFP